MMNKPAKAFGYFERPSSLKNVYIFLTESIKQME
jgi:hypothetical protein